MPVVPQSSEASSSFAYAPGDVIADKYELEEVLGQGGMGAVFRARNTAIDMPVAIKLIRGDLNKELFSGRLLQEARAAAKLSHPAIVRVFDVGRTSLGDPFIVMELLSGESLASVMEREGRLTSVRAVQLLLPIADALSAAHTKGFVHRDVKPDNVFVVVNEEQLQPKLVDFGIVKLEQHDKDSKLTQVGTVLGSPDYMSPEQARGFDNIDLRSDVWSFSVMLYEGIAGQTPFSSANYNALLRQIVEEEPASLRALSAADAQLSSIVARGMSKDPAQRFQSMSQLGRALAQWLVGQGVAEDACGVSVEAKWLSRTTDPQARAAGRASYPGPPDSWPEPPSGVRAVNSDTANAPTVQVASHAGTPVSVSPVARSIPPRERRLYLGIAGGALVLAGLFLWWKLSSDQGSKRVSPATSSVEALQALPEPRAGAASTPAPTPTTKVVAPVEAAPSASVEPPAKAPAARPPAAKPKPRTAQPQQDSPAAAGKPAPPTSDLLSPY